MHSLGYLPDLRDIRDFNYTVTQPIQLPMHVDQRTGPVKLPDVYDQGQLGSCTANALAFNVEYCRRREQLPDFVPSRLFIYHQERVIEGTVNSDSGAMIRDGIKALNIYGAPDEKLWPYDIKKFAANPPQVAFSSALKDRALSYYRIPDGNLYYMRYCLAMNGPFVFGIPVYQSFEDSNNGIIPMPHAGEQLLGGHAIAAVGYDDRSQIVIFRNSWSANWGDKGYGYIPYAYMTRLAADNWYINLVSKS